MKGKYRSGGYHIFVLSTTSISICYLYATSAGYRQWYQFNSSFLFYFLSLRQKLMTPTLRYCSSSTGTRLIHKSQSIMALLFLFFFLSACSLSRHYDIVSYNLASQRASQPAQPWLEGKNTNQGGGEVTQCCTVQECTALSLWGLHFAENLPHDTKHTFAWH